MKRLQYTLNRRLGPFQGRSGIISRERILFHFGNRNPTLLSSGPWQSASSNHSCCVTYCKVRKFKLRESIWRTLCLGCDTKSVRNLMTLWRNTTLCPSANSSPFIFFFCDTSTRSRVMASPYGASCSHTMDKPHSVGILCTSDQPNTETSIWQHTTLTREKHPFSRRDLNSQPPNKRTKTHDLNLAFTGIGLTSSLDVIIKSNRGRFAGHVLLTVQK